MSKKIKKSAALPIHVWDVQVCEADAVGSNLDGRTVLAHTAIEAGEMTLRELQSTEYRRKRWKLAISKITHVATIDLR